MADHDIGSPHSDHDSLPGQLAKGSVGALARRTHEAGNEVLGERQINDLAALHGPAMPGGEVVERRTDPIDHGQGQCPGQSAHDPVLLSFADQEQGGRRSGVAFDQPGQLAGGRGEHPGPHQRAYLGAELRMRPMSLVVSVVLGDVLPGTPSDISRSQHVEAGAVARLADGIDDQGATIQEVHTMGSAVCLQDVVRRDDPPRASGTLLEHGSPGHRGLEGERRWAAGQGHGGIASLGWSLQCTDRRRHRAVEILTGSDLALPKRCHRLLPSDRRSSGAGSRPLPGPDDAMFHPCVRGYDRMASYMASHSSSEPSQGHRRDQSVPDAAAVLGAVREDVRQTLRAAWLDPALEAAAAYPLFFTAAWSAIRPNVGKSFLLLARSLRNEAVDGIRASMEPPNVRKQLESEMGDEELRRVEECVRAVHATTVKVQIVVHALHRAARRERIAGTGKEEPPVRRGVPDWQRWMAFQSGGTERSWPLLEEATLALRAPVPPVPIRLLWRWPVAAVPMWDHLRSHVNTEAWKARALRLRRMVIGGATTLPHPIDLQWGALRARGFTEDERMALAEVLAAHDSAMPANTLIAATAWMAIGCPDIGLEG